MNKRSDVIVSDRNGLPLLLAECKAPEVDITQKVFEQIAVYNMTIKAACMMVTNGLDHYCLLAASQDEPIRFLNEIPDYKTLLTFRTDA